MKFKVVFAAIALFAIASAFTTRKNSPKANLKYQIVSISGTHVRVIQTIDYATREEGTEPGMYTCENSGNCLLEVNNSTPDGFDSGVAYYLNTGSKFVGQSTGTLINH